jgi:hypothetical protein
LARKVGEHRVVQLAVVHDCRHEQVLCAVGSYALVLLFLEELHGVVQPVHYVHGAAIVVEARREDLVLVYLQLLCEAARAEQAAAVAARQASAGNMAHEQASAAPARSAAPASAAHRAQRWM